MAPTPDGTIGGTLSWAVWFLGEVMFKWVPGAVVQTVGTAPAGSPPSPLIQPINSAVSVPQVVDYLQTASAPGTYDALFHGWSTFVAFSVLVSLGLIVLIIYCSIRMFQIRQTERRKFASAQNTVVAQDLPRTQLRWARIEEEANSESDQARRLAILEADIMLNELLDSLGYKGETMADKMRAADRANFRTLDLAWEAHRMRNRIAHEADSPLLSSREVKRIIGLYQQVFREFRFVE